MNDEDFMGHAIAKAKLALMHGNQPFGAVLASDGKIVASSGDRLLTEMDVTQHAEMRCISKATKARQSLFLEDCTLYTTFEPCVMCASATIYAFIPRLVIGAVREQVPHFFKLRNVRMQHVIEDADYDLEVVTGVLADEVVALFNGLERYAPVRNQPTYLPPEPDAPVSRHPPAPQHTRSRP